MNLIKFTTRRIRANRVWKQLLKSAAGGGIARQELARVKEYLFSGMGAVSPRYEFENQEPAYYMPGLKAQPWHSRNDFSQAIGLLERSFSTIKDELDASLAHMQLINQPDGLSESGSWEVFFLFVLGHKLEENCALFPQTTSIIASIPGATDAGNVLFSRLEPGAKIDPHCGPVNTRIRIHLGLSIPQDCTIRVGNETRTWEAGKCLVFDDSFNHQVQNDSDLPRVILLVDIWHPELSQGEIFALREIDRLSGRKAQIIGKILEG